MSERKKWVGAGLGLGQFSLHLLSLRCPIDIKRQYEGANCGSFGIQGWSQTWRYKCEGQQHIDGAGWMRPCWEVVCLTQDQASKSSNLQRLGRGGGVSKIAKMSGEPWLVWLSGLSAGLWTERSLVQFPVKVHAWVAGQVPNWGRYERQPVDASLSHWCFSPFFPSL